MEKKIAALALFTILLFGCIQQEGETPPAAFGAVNGSSFEGGYAKEGSVIQADYTLMLENGSILDSSIESAALEAGVYAYGRKYGVMTFPIKKDNGYLEKFTYSFVGMYEGQKKRITLLPKEAYGLENESKVISGSRVVKGGRLETVPIGVFTEKGIDVQVNASVQANQFWNATIMEIKTGSGQVVVRHDPQLGQKIRWFEMEAEVVEVTDDSFAFQLNPIVGEMYQVPESADAKTFTKVKVISMDNETILFDYNHPLAGKTIMFDIVLVKILQ